MSTEQMREDMERAAEIAQVAATIQKFKDTIVRQYAQDNPDDALVFALDVHARRMDALTGNGLRLIQGGAS